LLNLSLQLMDFHLDCIRGLLATLTVQLPDLLILLIDDVAQLALLLPAHLEVIVV